MGRVLNDLPIVLPNRDCPECGSRPLFRQNHRAFTEAGHYVECPNGHVFKIKLEQVADDEQDEGSE